MKIVDLSARIDENLWYYGTPYIPYQSEQLAFMEKNGYNTSKHVLTSHTGTHIECDRHWDDKGMGIDRVNLSYVYGSAKILRFHAGDEAYYRITREMLAEADAGRLAEGDICILSTGWEDKLNEERYTWESPFITPEAAEYLVEKKVKLVALDTPMIGDPRDGMDYVPEGIRLPDLVLLSAGIPYILGLVNTKELPECCTFAGAPLKLKDADGSPVRAFAVIEDRA